MANSEVMNFDKRHNKGQAQLFRNYYLEMLTKTHPLVIWGLYLPIMLYFLYISYIKLDFGVIELLLIFFGGMLFWTFFEYIMHRFAFNWVGEREGAKNIGY